MVHVLVVSPVFSELCCRVNFVGLPVCAVFPPFITVGVATKYIIQTVIVAQICAYEILEDVAYFVRYSNIATCSPCIAMEEPDAIFFLCFGVA